MRTCNIFVLYQLSYAGTFLEVFCFIIPDILGPFYRDIG